MSTNVAKPVKVAIIGASGTYGKGILARAEEIGVEAVVVTRSQTRRPKSLTCKAAQSLEISTRKLTFTAWRRQPVLFLTLGSRA